MSNKFSIEPMTIEVELNNPNICMETWVESRDQFLEIDYKSGLVRNKSNGDQWSIDDYKKQVLDLDLGMSYFSVAKFKFKSSLALRELFYTFTEYKGKWARTARYSTVNTMTCSSEMYESGKTEAAFDVFIEMTKLYNEGKFTQFDQVRETMPISYQVSWECSMPIKQFIKYVSLVYVHLKDTLPSLWEGLWTACIKVPELRPWMSKVLKYSKSDEVTKYLIKGNEAYTKEQFNALFKKLDKVGMVLYSQLIRHEGTDCCGYIEFLKHLPYSNQLHNCKMSFPIYVHQSKGREKEMLQTRCSWFAVTDNFDDNNTWGSILKHYIPEGANIDDYKHMFKFFDEDGNFCSDRINKYTTDDSLRIHKGYNSYFPDAFALEWKDLIYKRAERYGWNPLLRLYEQIFDKGYVKDNPNNPDRMRYISLNGE